MITLLTGQPGNGKTSFTINYIREELKKNRVIYTCGIPKLTLPVIPINRNKVIEWSKRLPLIGQFDDEGEQIYELTEFAEGSLIIVDEAQKSFGLTGTNVPDYIQHLTEHRHHGIDFLFITQAPFLVHQIVRNLASKHYHIRSTWHGRQLYEWADFQEKPTSASSVSIATVKRHTIDPTTFPLYESASLHTKISRSIPFKAWFFGIVMILVPILIFFSFNRVMNRTKPQDPPAETHMIKAADKSPHQPQNMQQVTQVQNIVKTVYKLPEIVNWSSISACLSMGSNCKCYDQHAVEVEIPPLLCRDAAKKGWHY